MVKFKSLLCVLTAGVSAWGGILLSSDMALAGSARVRGYYRKDGTYVRPHIRNTPSGGYYGGSSSGSYGGYQFGSGVPSGTSTPYGTYDSTGLSYTKSGSVNTLQMYMDFGKQAFQKQDYETALSWFRKVVKLNPQSIEAVQAIRDTETKLVASPKKISGASQTAAGATDLFRTYMNLGKKAFDSQDYQLALSWFEKALEIQPQSEEATKAVADTKLRNLVLR
jgi:predicted ATPase